VVHVLEPVVHVLAPVVHVLAPVVHVLAPVVHVLAPVVHVLAPVVHVLAPVVHVLELEHLLQTSTQKKPEHLLRTSTQQELEHLFRTSTQRVHTERELEVLVQMLELLLEAGTRQAHTVLTVLLQRRLLKSPTTKRSGSFRNPPIVPMILSMCQS
jgi:hypothetical protein